MKITKYHQSCLLIETKGKRILVDPGNIAYSDDMYEKEWTNIDIILISHKHSDHCFTEIINKIAKRDNAKVYASNETVSINSLLNVNVVANGDTIKEDNIVIEVVKAIHGYLPAMKNGSEVKENIGFIIDDGQTRLYHTSDTICFNNDYKCDILCMPFNGNGLTMGLHDGMLFIKDISPKIVIPVHLEHAILKVDTQLLKQTFENNNIVYKILNIGETFEYMNN